jgi:RNA polymerase sigma-70 factor (ECF subfamily)
MTKQEAFLALYEPVHERFERFCRARVYGNLDYRDLMNDTLIVAYTKIDELKSNDAFVYFLFGIAVRILSNNKRKKHEERIHNDQAILGVISNETNPETEMDIHFLYLALQQLPEKQSECIILFEISGFSIKEIAQTQQAGESAVKLRLKRGREKLMEILQTKPSENKLLTQGERSHE